MKQITTLILVWVTFVTAWGQIVPGDECLQAIEIKNVTNYCSANGQYSNVGATPTDYTLPVCFDATTHDVWFRFVPKATDVIITVIGATATNPGGTLRNPQVALYFNSCASTAVNNIECGTDSRNNIIEIYQGGLFIGQPYYIRVDGRNGQTGTFQLCINNYFAPKFPGSDCSSAAILCDKSAFSVESVTGAGNDPNELDDAPCFQGGLQGIGFESNSSWFKWVCKTTGSLTFIITPTKVDDDLDFVLYELTNGIDDCQTKTPIRCEAAGEDVALYPSPCHGPTGLRDESKDTSEPPGCNQGQDNFIASIDIEAGKAYALAINNYTSTGNGFSIEFGGTSEFQGPDISLSILPDTGLRCDQVFTIVDNSVFNFGTIDRYTWGFGEGSDPITANGPGPHQVMYNSFGEKVISLQVETDRGCLVTDTTSIYAEPCCIDLPPPTIQASVSNLICAGVPNGSILTEGMNGQIWYKFALEDGEYSFNNYFGNLDAGSYLIHVVDAKGCEGQELVTITEPQPLDVDLGADQEIDLGYTTQIEGTYSPPVNIVTGWYSNKGDTITCLDPQCLQIEVLPPGTTTYVVQIMDATGCVALDTIEIRVNNNRPIFFPNVISPNGDNINDVFYIGSNLAATGIEVLRVFDRWGGLLFEGHNLPLNDQFTGWDGTRNGEPLPPGVYVFTAVVHFVDNVSLPYSGDITIVR
ncbi:MAG: gliding motility-associated C-terminal domain-containing protein [Saprospiraceae bacterium]